MVTNLKRSAGEWLRIVDPTILPALGRVRHALFDFDGTISVLREGWEGVMAPMMVEMILGGTPYRPEIEAEVRAWVDRSTGILTIKQMRWLAEAVRRHGLCGEPKTAAEYKAIYLQRLMVRVEERLAALGRGDFSPIEKMIAGASEFVQALHRRGVKLYLASGTDHTDVVREAGALGVAQYFGERIYGAIDGSQAQDKARVIQRILEEHGLGGTELLVIGDGPVEIREAVGRGAVALGVASDEVGRQGWNVSKVARLEAAGAHLLVADFRQYTKLLGFFA